MKLYCGGHTGGSTLAADLEIGSHVRIGGHPCKVTEISGFGEHEQATAYIVGQDIFTSKKYDIAVELDVLVQTPLVKRTEFQCLSADPNTGKVCLLTESGAVKDDLNLPDSSRYTDYKKREQTPEDMKLSQRLVAALDKGGKTIVAIVQSACGMEKIVDMKELDGPPVKKQKVDLPREGNEGNESADGQHSHLG